MRPRRRGVYLRGIQDVILPAGRWRGRVVHRNNEGARLVCLVYGATAEEMRARKLIIAQALGGR